MFNDVSSDFMTGGATGLSLDQLIPSRTAGPSGGFGGHAAESVPIAMAASSAGGSSPSTGTSLFAGFGGFFGGGARAAPPATTAPQTQPTAGAKRAGGRSSGGGGGAASGKAGGLAKAAGIPKPRPDSVAAGGEQKNSGQGRPPTPWLVRLDKCLVEFQEADSTNVRYFGIELRTQMKTLNRLEDDYKLTPGVSEEEMVAGRKKLSAMIDIVKGQRVDTSDGLGVVLVR